MYLQSPFICRRNWIIGAWYLYFKRMLDCRFFVLELKRFSNEMFKLALANASRHVLLHSKVLEEV